jgi:uncharacterized surface protein with fasciclin (FAS1) repeats
MNLKRFLNSIKLALLAVVTVATIGLTGCSNSDDGPKVYNGTVLDLIQDAQFKQSSTVTADLALDSLVKYLKIYPNLTELVSGTTPYTLFAPSNTAFANLLATPGFPAKISLINPDIIAGVLAFHIAPGKILKSQLTSGLSLGTAYPAATTDDKIIVNADGTLLTGSSNKSIQLVATDKQATNGVVHIVGSVMIPQSVGATLTPILGTAAGTILLGKDFSYLAYMIGYADNGVAVAGRISSILANPINANTNPNGITVFAPVNAVFVAAYNGATGKAATNVPTAAEVQAFIGSVWTGGGTGTAAATLKNHIAMGQYVVTASSGATVISNGLSIQSILGITLTAATGTPVNATTNPYGVVIISPSTPPSQAPIVVKDLPHSNGVVQAIAGILKPQ